MKAIIFCRVSSREQEESGYSLPSQEKLLTEYAAKNQFKVVKIYSISESASGKQLRKMFNEVLQYASKNRVNIILCEKIDRLTRNLKDAATVDDWVKEDPSRSVHFVKENFTLNRETRAHDNLVWDMKVAIARFYANNLSEEVKKGQKEKLAQGWLPTKSPLGYKATGERRRLIHIIDEERAPLIRKMFELYATGNYSLSALTKIMKKEGLRGDKGQAVCKSTMHRLLSNHFYFGKNEWMGGLYDGKQEPLVSKDLYDLVQRRLSAKTGGQPMYTKHEYIFKAKIRCEECNGLITWERQKGHLYGHCNHHKLCSQKIWVKQYQIEEQLFPYIDELVPMGKNILEVLEMALKDGHSGEIDYNTNKREGFNKIIRTADKRIETAYRDKIDGRMPPQLCEKMIKEFTDEKEDAINSLSKLNEDRYIYYQAGMSVHKLVARAKEIYESEKATIEEKRLLLSQVFSNLTLNEGKIDINYTLGAAFWAEWMPRLNSSFEPSKMPSFTNKTDDFSSVCPVVRGRRDSNP